ncbi:nucleophile aminohydrolase [Dipodascopsis tothii]|uniref:nucleophile aminohydrolase n=1 Tax=Dipodascopsis tothii TaxID=44089 RepID=UPI0034CF9360
MAMSLDQEYLSVDDSKQLKFSSRRSVVHSKHGIVSCTQPLAAAAGLKILEQGGNAVDAAVATAAALAFFEPAMTSPGGDAFALFHDAKTNTLKGMNGSGRAAKAVSLEALAARGVSGRPKLAPNSVHCVTVPGGPAAWCDSIAEWGSGKVTIADVLKPAISYAENGAPISEISASLWYRGQNILKAGSDNAKDLFKADGTTPQTGDIWKNQYFADTLKLIAEKGKPGFYEGVVAERIVKAVQDKGGFLELSDLKEHTTSFVEPISLDFMGHTLWECPPGGQGLLALLALGTVRELLAAGTIPPVEQWKHNSPEYLHVVIETLKMAFRDGEYYVADPEKVDVPVAAMLTPEYLQSRAALFDAAKANPVYAPGVPKTANQSDTVYLSVTDSEGNACSFINSCAGMFGTGIVPDQSGWVLQNRGVNFSLLPGMLNTIEGGKRPYHTIIPAMITKDDAIYAAFGVMGGFMQPQGHLQVFLNHVVFGLDPQKALDSPRICITPGPIVDGQTLTDVNVEASMAPETIEGLKKLGHVIKVQKPYDPLFGRGQFIRLTKQESGEVLHSAGSDPRGDGAAYPFVKY